MFYLQAKMQKKLGTGFQRVNELCKEFNVLWNFKKEAYGFFFEFIRTNVHLNIHINDELSKGEQLIFNLIKNNDSIRKPELAIRINKSEKSIQHLISSLTKNGLIIRVG